MKADARHGPDWRVEGATIYNGNSSIKYHVRLMLFGARRQFKSMASSRFQMLAQRAAPRGFPSNRFLRQYKDSMATRGFCISTLSTDQTFAIGQKRKKWTKIRLLCTMSREV
ncbi:MAG TPA: hypothetical protein VGR47_07255 [Terracidiphilus sp.]|nr:hypothetical protein [Terracidiphilus sp.]